MHTLRTSAQLHLPPCVHADSGLCSSVWLTSQVPLSVSAELDQVSAQISCVAVAWSEQGQSVGPFGLGSAARQQLPEQGSLCPGCQRASTHALLASRGQASPALLSVSVDFLAGQGACLLPAGPQDWYAQVVAQPLTSQGEGPPVVDLLLLIDPSQGHRY